MKLLRFFVCCVLVLVICLIFFSAYHSPSEIRDVSEAHQNGAVNRAGSVEGGKPVQSQKRLNDRTSVRGSYLQAIPAGEQTLIAEHHDNDVEDMRGGRSLVLKSVDDFSTRKRKETEAMSDVDEAQYAQELRAADASDGIAPEVTERYLKLRTMARNLQSGLSAERIIEQWGNPGNQRQESGNLIWYYYGSSPHGGVIRRPYPHLQLTFGTDHTLLDWAWRQRTR